MNHIWHRYNLGNIYPLHAARRVNCVGGRTNFFAQSEASQGREPHAPIATLVMWVMTPVY